MWFTILCKVWYLFCVIWWGYCTARTYKHFDKLPKGDTERDSVSIGILAEVILLIYSIIDLLTI